LAIERMSLTNTWEWIVWREGGDDHSIRYGLEVSATSAVLIATSLFAEALCGADENSRNPP
jgi:hypothetical protein